MRNEANFYYLNFVCVVFLMSFGVFGINAQSGRRPVPTPIPNKTPEPETKRDEAVDQKIAVKKAAHSMIISSEIPLELMQTFDFPDAWYRWINERLANSKDVEAQYGGQSNRKQATEKAKLTDESYVLFVQLSEDPFRQPQYGRPTAIDRGVRISYFLLSPQTGKPKLQGIAILDPIVLRSKANTIKRTLCYPGMTDSNYLLLEASFQVADRILGGLGAAIPKQDCKRF